MKTVKTAAAVLLAFAFARDLSAGEGRIRHLQDGMRGRYIVVFNEDLPGNRIPSVAAEIARRHGGRLGAVWHDALKGFVIEMPEQRAEAMSHDPRIAYIQEDAPMYMSASMPTNISPAACDPTVAGNCTTTTGDNRVWHLDRIDQTQAVPGNRYAYCESGPSVYIYVVDTGVMGLHSEFGGRVLAGVDKSGDGYPANLPCGGWPVAPDPNGPAASLLQNNYHMAVYTVGHGTSAASAAAGRKVGVAKDAFIVPVKTTRCDAWNAQLWHSATAYSVGQRVMTWNPSTGSDVAQYRCAVSGTSGGTQPSGTGTDIIDGSAHWKFDPPSPANAQLISYIATGLDWIISADNPNRSQPGVVTMSTFRSAGASGIDPIETEVRNVIAYGFAVIASANNQNDDACHTTPARLSRVNIGSNPNNRVITVGGTMLSNNPDSINLSDFPNATQADGGLNVRHTEPAYDAAKPTLDRRWVCGPGDSTDCSAPPIPNYQTEVEAYQGYTAGSNWGACVTLYAPAKNIATAKMSGPNDYREGRIAGESASGTSWSAPIVAGYVARLLKANPTLTVNGIYDRLMADALQGVIDTSNEPAAVLNSGNPNKLLHGADISITQGPVSTTATPSATLSVTASAGTPVTYQWFQVNSGFDLSKPRGAASSTPLAGTGSSMTVTPSQPTGYWVRVTSDCSSAESDIAVVTPSVPAPTSLAAVANGPTVTVTWNAVAGAARYFIERKQQGDTAWHAVVDGGVPPSTSISDTPPATAAGFYLYRAYASYSSTPPSSPQYSNVDFANTTPFTGDPATARVTAIKASDVLEARQALNRLCDAVGIARVYVPADLLPSSLHFAGAGDFNDLRSRINAVRGNAAVNVTAFPFRESLVGGVFIKAIHIEDIRGALK